MTAKRSFNAAVASTQLIKLNNKKQGSNSSSWLQKLDILYARMVFLPKPGLKPIKHVLIHKWRTVIPHPYKDKIYPLQLNKIKLNTMLLGLKRQAKTFVLIFIGIITCLVNNQDKMVLSFNINTGSCGYDGQRQTVKSVISF